ncbi:phage major capsid protein [Bradyrhizobium sp. SZCCHNR2032]|uniref:phage major capsid protein n=1 Tax=Bradyrhizobium sp. SZCCHNR2032 TaxID=3057384 RepID=UPI002916EE96|nr:phage major capsid protein [Bradyrhizobium sp. SZCCHNR2032]
MNMNALELKDTGLENEDPAAQVGKALEELKAKLETKAANDNKLTERLDRLEAKMNRPQNGPANDNEPRLETKAFNSFIRRGVERMDPLEAKALTVATDSAAGYLAPEQFGAEILKALRQFSPIRQYARVITIGGSEIKYPRRTGSTTAYWVGETDDRTESEAAYEQVAFAPYELATFTDVSNQLLEDNAYNLEGELSSDFAESFGIAEGSAFVTGNGTGKPKGIMNAAGIQTMITGNGTGFPTSAPADVLINMFHKLPGVHAQNGAWLMNRNTLGSIRTWKDSMGRYLVVDPISDGAPTTLLGRPIVETIDMDDIGANKYPILFGDLKGYRIVDRIGLSILRDPYTLATKGQVRFHARRRVGADVTNPDRFVKLKVSAT